MTSPTRLIYGFPRFSTAKSAESNRNGLPAVVLNSNGSEGSNNKLIWIFEDICLELILTPKCDAIGGQVTSLKVMS